MIDSVRQWDRQSDILLDPPDCKPYIAFVGDEELGGFSTANDALWSCWEEAERVLGERAPHNHLAAWVEDNTRIIRYDEYYDDPCDYDY